MTKLCNRSIKTEFQLLLRIRIAQTIKEHISDMTEKLIQTMLLVVLADKGFTVINIKNI